MTTKVIVALWASYSLTGPIFHTTCLSALWEPRCPNRQPQQCH